MAKKDMLGNIDKLVPDTSVIIEGLVSVKIENKEIKVEEVIIHEAVLAELEHQANLGKAVGFVGLDELERIKKIADKGLISLKFSGKRPSGSEIKYASLGEIDALIRSLAWEEDAVLMTADKVQHKVASAKGMRTLFIPQEKGIKKLKLDGYFDETTMSVHLREKVHATAKKGRPGDWQFVKVSDKELTQDDIKSISRELIEEARLRSDGFLEIEREGSTIIQLGLYRIVVTKPPLSDGWEITAVRPVKRLSLKDYQLSEKLMKRISEQAEGILIAGAPGHGKTTFAQGLAEFYANKGKIVKTIEAPRDLILPESITQYAISRGSPQEIQDILLLSRPDYTIFDEMRNTSDFLLYTDLRLSGIGLAGVVHATSPVDAIQRFVGRIELGLIPHVVDTVIFIKNGTVFKVLSLQMVVKVPAGMTESDLARPIVTVTDFETKKLEYELYKYGEETVVIPVKKGEKSASHQLAEKSIEQEFKRYAKNVKVDVTSDKTCTVYVPDDAISKIIGRQGKNITIIEKKLGMRIDIQPLGAVKDKEKGSGTVEYTYKITKKGVHFFLEGDYVDKEVHIHVDGDYLLSARVGKKGVIKVRKDNKIARILIDALNAGEPVEIKL